MLCAHTVAVISVVVDAVVADADAICTKYPISYVVYISQFDAFQNDLQQINILMDESSLNISRCECISVCECNDDDHLDIYSEKKWTVKRI